MVAATDDLDACVFEPVKDGLGNSGDLVPDDHAGDELLANSFRCPLSLSAPAKEAVIGLGWALTPLTRLSLARR